MWVLIPIFYGAAIGWLLGWTFIPGYGGTHCNSAGDCFNLKYNTKQKKFGLVKNEEATKAAKAALRAGGVEK